MKALGCGLTALIFVACGPNLAPDPVMTPQQRLQEQERLAYETEQERKKLGERGVWEEEDEQIGFDEEGAKQELQRASLGAQTCSEIAQSAVPKEKVKLGITWASGGHVRQVEVAPPFKGHEIEACLVAAYKSVIVQPFKEPEYRMNWELELK